MAPNENHWHRDTNRIHRCGLELESNRSPYVSVVIHIDLRGEDIGRFQTIFDWNFDEKLNLEMNSSDEICRIIQALDLIAIQLNLPSEC